MLQTRTLQDGRGEPELFQEDASTLGIPGIKCVIYHRNMIYMEGGRGEGIISWIRRTATATVRSETSCQYCSPFLTIYELAPVVCRQT